MHHKLGHVIVAQFTDQKLIFANISKIKLESPIFLSRRYTLEYFKLIPGSEVVVEGHCD